MGYKVELKPGAQKELARLDRLAQRRIAAFIDELSGAENPRQHGIAMQGAERLWRYRLGDYRLITEINDNIITTIIIIILKIAHWREAYR